LDDLEEYGTNVIVTTVDVSKARTGSFFHMAGQAPPAYDGPELDGKGKGYSGLATALRKSDKRKSVLVRDPSRPGAPEYSGPAAMVAADKARERNATGWLSPMTNYGTEDVEDDMDTATTGPLGTNRNDIRFLTAIGGWIAPTQFERLNFRLVDVARATSAAPAFLPGELKLGWSGAPTLDLQVH
jgi:hypothetical protein